MAKIEPIILKVKIKGIRKLNKATKAIEKATKAIEKYTSSAEKGIAAFKELSAALPLICEIEQEEEKARGQKNG